MNLFTTLVFEGQTTEPPQPDVLLRCQCDFSRPVGDPNGFFPFGKQISCPVRFPDDALAFYFRWSWKCLKLKILSFFQAEGGTEEVKCRYDWHQTATKVTVAIYAKKYDPDLSFVEVNPIRLKTHIYFPAEKGSFNLDLELRGVNILSLLFIGLTFFDS